MCGLTLYPLCYIAQMLDIHHGLRDEKVVRKYRRRLDQRQWMQAAEWRSFHCNTSDASESIFSGNPHQKPIWRTLAPPCEPTYRIMAGHRWVLQAMLTRYQYRQFLSK
jgi:hypothetical protein